MIIAFENNIIGITKNTQINSAVTNALVNWFIDGKGILNEYSVNKNDTMVSNSNITFNITDSIILPDKIVVLDVLTSKNSYAFSFETTSEYTMIVKNIARI